MCGILGLAFSKPVARSLIDGLQRLEYRGYDSAGLAVWANKKMERVRAVGRVSSLESVWNKNPIDGHIGLAHTRWATHGGVTLENTHPHGTTVQVIQNGIVENMDVLKKRAQSWGATFQSTTDAELFALFLEKALQAQEQPLDSLSPQELTTLVRKTFCDFKGSFAIVCLLPIREGVLVAMRQGYSPLAVGKGSAGFSCGSDALALSGLADHLAYLEDGDMAAFTQGALFICDRQGEKQPTFVPNTTISETLIRGAHQHFMHKEIHEQPCIMRTLQDTYVHTDVLHEAELWKSASLLRLVGCGTAFYAGEVAAYWFARFANLPVLTELSSEVRSKALCTPAGTLWGAISQSGETADTLSALTYAKDQPGAKLFAILNVIESSIGRLVDWTLGTHAGPEIGVASTKAFTAQLWTLLYVAIKAGQARNVISTQKAASYIENLETLPDVLAQTLTLESTIQERASLLDKATSVLYLGRSICYPLALEGALKLKEISYIHAEGLAAGEIKHGPMALLEPGLPLILLAPSGPWFAKTLSALQEVTARGVDVLTITDAEGVRQLPAQVQRSALVMPKVPDFLAPFTLSMVLQLLSYHVTLKRGLDIDRPRNLAKSVTVE